MSRHFRKVKNLVWETYNYHESCHVEIFKELELKYEHVDISDIKSEVGNSKYKRFLLKFKDEADEAEFILRESL